MKNLTLLLLLFTCGTTIAQKILFHPGITTICHASDIHQHYHTPIPSNFNLSADPTSEINVTYNGFTPEAQAAFQFAVDIWARTITSSVPIRITANWSMLGANVLGSASAVTTVSNFENAPFKDVRYPIALAEKLARKQLNLVSQSEVSANFSSEIDWYYGTDANPGTNQYDLVSVVLHEIGHGLGFSASFGANGQIAAWGLSNTGAPNTPIIYDLFLRDTFGNQLIDTSIYPNNSAELLAAVTNNNVLYASEKARITFGNFPPIYSPNPWNGGSSISHLDETVFAPGNENSLMSPQFGLGEAIHLPGDITEAIFAELGWVYSFFEHSEPIFFEELNQSIQLSLQIESDSPIVVPNIKLVWSEDNFQNSSISVPISEKGNEYTFDLGAFADPTLIQYYFQYTEPNNRFHEYPLNGLENPFTLTVGEDLVQPTISHIPQGFITSNEFEVTFSSYDNFGIDTVYLEYKVGSNSNSLFQGVEKQNVTDSTFKIGLSRADLVISSNDSVFYKIYAEDKSKNENIRVFPEDKFLTLINAETGQAQSSYLLSFDSNNILDSIALNGLELSNIDGFSSNSIHSKHPYSNGLKNTSSLLLKFPISLMVESVISFDEIILTEPGKDFLRIEGSTDGGLTWTKIRDDQDANGHISWQMLYNSSLENGSSLAAGDQGLFVSREIALIRSDLPFRIGDDLHIRFSLISDESNNGWGIALDNIEFGVPIVTNIQVKEPAISIYPNPVEDVIYINTKEAFTAVKILSLSGRNVFTTSTEIDKVDLRMLNPGVYVIQILKGNQVLNTSRIIKK